MRRKVGLQVEVWQIYSPDGELLAEYPANGATSAPQKEYGYRNGEMLVTASSGANVQWMVTDQLGTPRIIADRTGSLSGIRRHDYLPFGEEMFAGSGNRTAAGGYVADGVRQKFTEKERDTETGLDYFEARYYSSVQGRFTSPDEFKGGPEELFEEVDPHDPLFYADIAEPQSLNKYHYCLNNPLRYVDPDGHQTTTADALKTAAAAGAALEAIPGGQAAGTVILIGTGVAAAGYVIYNTDWKAVANGLNTVFGGSNGAANCPAGVNCGIPQYMNKSNEGAANPDNSPPRGSRNPATAEAAAEGREQHEKFKEKVKAKEGWKSEPSLKDPKTGRTVKPDAVTPSGRPVELKPNTPSGRAQGRRQLPGQERATGKKGRVVYYEPKRKQQNR